ncbi:MAG: DUF3078 domain-containing protein [Bacteroidia bacterium]
MKKIVTLFLMLLSLTSVAQTAQPDSTKLWKRGGVLALNFTQASFSNWAAGGVNSVSGQTLFNLFANYKKGSTTWDNTLDMAYGLLQQGKSSLIRKTDDKFDFTSKYGRYAFAKVWYYSVLFNFKTQFSPGYTYPNDTTQSRISDMLAPGYALLAIGLDYKPNDAFSLFISPFTGRTTIVTAPLLSEAGAFGVKPGETLRNEFGGYIRAQYRKDIMTNVNLATKLELFSNYLDRPQNVDLNWEVLLSMKVNKYLSASINTQMIYDHDITILREDGSSGPALQFREVLGIGFSAKF